MTSHVYVGDSREVHDDWSHPITVGCPNCHLVAQLLISKGEYPLEWNVWQKAVASMFLHMKYPDSHECDNFK